MSLGLRDAGFTVLAGADSDAVAMETHSANIGGLGYVGDLADPAEFLEHLQGWGIRRVDLVAGGPPCQPFSRAGAAKLRSLIAHGARAAHDPRAGLWTSFVEIVASLRPRAVLVENVPDLPVWGDGAVLIGIYESLREIGYEVDARVLDAYRHGVPQHRARLFIVGFHGDCEMNWPAPRRRPPSLWDAIGDLPPVPPAHREERSRYLGVPASPLQRRLRRGLRGDERNWVHDHITRDVRADDAEAFRLLDEGQTYKDLPARLRRYRSDIFDDKYKRLTWSEVSRSITAHIAKDGYWYIHPDQHRTLSVREAARVQTFPDRFRFAGEPSLRLRQIGNAVPPLLAEALGGGLIAGLAARAVPRRRTTDRLRHDLLGWHAHHAREYPWRATGISPWQVLMAEMCLHRTRADQVAPVFEELRRLAPTPAAMVEHEDECRRAMQSLGLRWRADNIIKVARVLVDHFDGHVPDTEFGLRALPGVGDYGAQAVLCFAFGRRAVLLDTNTDRIIGRIEGRDDRRRWQIRLDLHRIAGAAGPNAPFNYALLDLGALVCRAGNPQCGNCPISAHCATAGARVKREGLDLAA